MAENDEEDQEYSRLWREAKEKYPYVPKDANGESMKWGIITIVPIFFFMMIANLEAPKFYIIAFAISAIVATVVYYSVKVENTKNWRKQDQYVEARRMRPRKID